MSVSEYDDFGMHYPRAKELLIACGSELPTLLSLINDLTELDVLDLACGHGYYCRIASRLGARDVVGVDKSKVMLEIAGADEFREPLGIKYVCADVAKLNLDDLGRIAPFNCIFAFFLFNYASNRRMLEKFCQTIHRCLLPNGRLIAAIPNPDFQFMNAGTDNYRFRSTLIERHDEGNIFMTEILEHPPFRFKSHQWKKEVIEVALQDSGFANIVWHHFSISKEIAIGFGEDFWQNYLSNPPNIALTAELRTSAALAD
jgi:toxoflavin synthase